MKITNIYNKFSGNALNLDEINIMYASNSMVMYRWKGEYSGFLCSATASDGWVIEFEE